jgi:hypothetical protein
MIPVLVTLARTTREIQMYTIGKYLFVTLTALSAAGFVSSAFAQNLDPAREAAIRKCVQAAKKVPEGKGVDNQKGAVGIFKACMHKEGQNP